MQSLALHRCKNGPEDGAVWRWLALDYVCLRGAESLTRVLGDLDRKTPAQACDYNTAPDTPDFAAGRQATKPQPENQAEEREPSGYRMYRNSQV